MPKTNQGRGLTTGGVYGLSIWPLMTAGSSTCGLAAALQSTIYRRIPSALPLLTAKPDGRGWRNLGPLLRAAPKPHFRLLLRPSLFRGVLTDTNLNAVCYFHTVPAFVVTLHAVLLWWPRAENRGIVTRKGFGISSPVVICNQRSLSFK
jgi:hypothetical protein